MRVALLVAVCLALRASAQSSSPKAAMVAALAAEEPSASQVTILDQRAADATRSLLLVSVEDSRRARLGHAVLLARVAGAPAVLAYFRADRAGLLPRIVHHTSDSVTVAQLSDYGIEQERTLYQFDRDSGRVTGRVPHRPVRITHLDGHAGALQYQGTAGEQPVSGTLRIGPDGEPTGRVRLTPTDLSESTIPEEREIGGPEPTDTVYTAKVPGGRRLRFRVVETDREGREVPAAIQVLGGPTYPLPQSTLAGLRRARPKEAVAFRTIAETIGPRQVVGDQFWFGKSFYNGEGMTGVGELGWFDLTKRKYSSLTVPEIADWSASALLVEDEAVWVGLVRHPEGSDVPGGLLRYDRNTNQVRRYEVPAVVLSLRRIGLRLFLGTSDDLYAVTDAGLERYHFEPQPNGGYRVTGR